jgi:hypothetical protein
VAHEPHVRGLAGERPRPRHERGARRRVGEGGEQEVEELRLLGRGEHRLVLHRVGDAAEQVRREHRPPEVAGEDPDREREGARHLGKDPAAEALGGRAGGGGGIGGR